MGLQVPLNPIRSLYNLHGRYLLIFLYLSSLYLSFPWIRLVRLLRILNLRFLVL